jgi:hypothetical protein
MLAAEAVGAGAGGHGRQAAPLATTASAPSVVQLREANDHEHDAGDGDFGELDATKEDLAGKSWADLDFYEGLIETAKSKGVDAGSATAARLEADDPQRDKKIFAAVIDHTRLPLEQLNNYYHPGCGGASEVLRWILKQLEIEVVIEKDDKSGHRYIYLPNSDVGLIHGDDVYSKDLFELDGGDLLKNKAEIADHWDRFEDIRLEAVSELEDDVIAGNLDPALREQQAERAAAEAMPSATASLMWWDPAQQYWGANWSVPLAEVVAHEAFPPGYLPWLPGAQEGHPAALDGPALVECLGGATAMYNATQGEWATELGRTIEDRDDAVRRLALRLAQDVHEAITKKKILVEEKYVTATQENRHTTYGDKHAMRFDRGAEEEYWTDKRVTRNAERGVE